MDRPMGVNRGETLMPDRLEPKDDTQRLFKYAMGSFPSGVTVVSCLRDGVDRAMTASAVSSVSMDPPMILVCVSRSARFWTAIGAADRWAVSILAQEGQPHAEWLATPGRELAGQLDQVPHRRTRHGNAVLTDSLAVLECMTVQQIHAGDHDVFVGLVEWVGRGEGRDPLLYWRSRYQRLEQHQLTEQADSQRAFTPEIPGPCAGTRTCGG